MGEGLVGIGKNTDGLLHVFFVCRYHDFPQASYEAVIIIPIKHTHTHKQNKTKKWSSEKLKDFPSVTQLVNSQDESRLVLLAQISIINVLKGRQFAAMNRIYWFLPPKWWYLFLWTKVFSRASHSKGQAGSCGPTSSGLTLLPIEWSWHCGPGAAN